MRLHKEVCLSTLIKLADSIKTGKLNQLSVIPRLSLHCVKSLQIRRFCWSVFSGIRTEYVDLRSKSPFQFEYRKKRARKNCVFGHFSRIATIRIKKKVCCIPHSQIFDNYHTKLKFNTQRLDRLLFLWLKEKRDLRMFWGILRCKKC